MRLTRFLPVSALVAVVATMSCKTSTADDATGDSDSGDGTNASPPDTSLVSGSIIDASSFPAVNDAAVVGAGNDHCPSATIIPITTLPSELHASTTSATHDIDAPCTVDSGPDVFYRFTVSKRVLVYADTFGAGFDTVLFLLSSDCTPITTPTTAGDSVCNDGACGSRQGRIVALLEPGDYRLGLGGSGGASGDATIHFEIALAPSGAEKRLPQGASTQSGTTVGQSGNVDNEASSCVAAGPEDGYFWTTCPSDVGGTLSASTCGGATWATLLETENPRSKPYTCSQDSCDRQTAIDATIPAGAGLHVLLIDGQSGSDSGPYTMTVMRP